MQCNQGFYISDCNILQSQLIWTDTCLSSKISYVALSGCVKAATLIIVVSSLVMLLSCDLKLLHVYHPKYKVNPKPPNKILWPKPIPMSKFWVTEINAEMTPVKSTDLKWWSFMFFLVNSWILILIRQVSDCPLPSPYLRFSVHVRIWFDLKF